MSIHVPRNKQTLIRRLPDQITLRHGPRERLGRFFLAADKAARDRGVILSLSTDFELLREVNRMNLKHWYGLPPTFDSHYSGIDGSKGRSEERRVGKEWKSRWTPDHSKKRQDTKHTPN